MRPQTRGRPLGWLALFLGGWVTARVAILSADGVTPPLQAVRMLAAATPLTGNPTAPKRRAEPGGTHVRALATRFAPPAATGNRPAPEAATIAGSSLFRPPMSPMFATALSGFVPHPGTAGLSPALLVGAVKGTIARMIADDAADGAGHVGGAIMAPPVLPPGRIAASPSRLSLYAWAFVRKGIGSPAAPVASYGGSQLGAILTDRLATIHGVPVDGYARFAASPDTPDREVAAGIAIHPLKRLPLMLSVEERFRARGGNVPAVGATTGFVQPLPGHFRLDAYGAAGILGDARGTAYADAALSATRPVMGHAAHDGTIAIRAGAGAWLGGQTGVLRVDVGPRISADLRLSTRARIDAALDWRVRVAGDAAPGDGPALTLSTGF